MNKQPRPDSKKYTDLISEIDRGEIKIPKFQRDFVKATDKSNNEELNHRHIFFL